MNKVEILIISNTLDFTTDYVCLELYKRKSNYLRINRDEFQKYNITLDVLNCSMIIQMGNDYYSFDNLSLKSIYYRAPIYLRDFYQPNLSKEDQLFRTQWTAFIRSLTIFKNAIWVNYPEATFKAENKLLQLRVAHSLGMLCPNTYVTNTNKIILAKEKKYIVKSLDTAILRINNKEAFVYSNIIEGAEINDSNLNIAPIIIQDYITPKIDIRVTVIGGTLYPVRILKEGKGIEGDWRIFKNDIDFVPFDLPVNISDKCIKLVQMLGLAFGGIDLIESEGSFYFIEVNPTGEWAWLVKNAGLKIYEGICDYLEDWNG